jgi:adenylate cyclase
MASRIEKLSKRYGTTILVSEAVRDGAGDGYVFRFVDKTTPEGAHREMAIYELLGANRPDEPELEPFPERLRTLRAWEEAYSSYATEDWEEAATRLEALAVADPGDQLFKLYLNRCHAKSQPSRIA